MSLEPFKHFIETVQLCLGHFELIYRHPRDVPQVLKIFVLCLFFISLVHVRFGNSQTLLLLIGLNEAFLICCVVESVFAQLLFLPQQDRILIHQQSVSNTRSPAVNSCFHCMWRLECRYIDTQKQNIKQVIQVFKSYQYQVRLVLMTSPIFKNVNNCCKF